MTTTKTIRDLFADALEKAETNSDIAVSVETEALSEEERDDFVRGWEAAGGPVNDLESPCPWCAPWVWAPVIDVRGSTPEEWGADWYRQCRREIEAAANA